MIKQLRRPHKGRFTIGIIALLFLTFGGVIWILDTEKVIAGEWSTIIPTLFTILGVMFGLCQWLFPFPSNEDGAIVIQNQQAPRQPFVASEEQPNMKTLIKHYPYDVTLSYAGEDHAYANELASVLKQHGVQVFYDKHEKATLWGKNLYTYLSDLYQNKARFCVMLLSQYYAAKLWTNHEREAAQAHALKENEEYILPIRLDDTEIPGILPTVAYLRWPPENAETIANAILEKLSEH